MMTDGAIAMIDQSAVPSIAVGRIEPGDAEPGYAAQALHMRRETRRHIGKHVSHVKVTAPMITCRRTYRYALPRLGIRAQPDSLYTS